MRAAALLRRHLLEADAAGRRERLDIAADVEQIVVAGDGPEAATAIVLRPPADGIVAAEPCERRVRDAAHERVGIGDVGVVRPEFEIDVGQSSTLIATGLARLRRSSVVPPFQLVATSRQ